MIRAAILQGFDWSGRARRREVWAYLVFVVLLLVATAAAEIWIAAGSPKAPRFFCLLAAILLVPMISLCVRRLHDRGHAGGWLVLALVPVAGWLCVLYLLLAPTDSRADAPDTPLALRLIGGLVVAAVVLLFACRAFWAPYWIPSGSMKPTLLAGDYMIARFVNADDLMRGNVVVFRAAATGTTHTARLIGLPGDRVQMRAGRIVLNDAVVVQAESVPFAEIYAPQGPSHSLPRCGNAPVGAGGQCITQRLKETLPDGATYDVLDIMQGMSSDDTAVFAVPQAAYLVLGDNRDDSLDSRFSQNVGGIGFVAADDMIGRADRVVISAAGSTFWAVWSWRAGRFWMALP